MRRQVNLRKFAKVVNLVVGLSFVGFGISAIIDSLLTPSSLTTVFYNRPWLGVLIGVISILLGILAWCLSPLQLFWSSLLGPAALLMKPPKDETNSAEIRPSEKPKSNGA